ncbi:hypothetical protein BJ878DRAFT_493440 [Calycina marina]|uniref:Iron-sulfur cluster assembly factor IBA57 homolog, mitochondrial n=1 Tax=Calycina marina TaxID=1763456 RepID=A0A9P7Z8B6_9HELO|nr:hypothetical protein BJ878DRAFT_493440 [Calycina marina]
MKSLLTLPKLLPRSFICQSCIRSTRIYSTTANPPPPPPSAISLLSSRRLISLRGPDATKYLQGVITANLSPSTPRGSGFYAAFLNAQGRVLNDVFIYSEMVDGERGWLIEVDAEEAERLAKHIKRYRLRAKFDVRLVDEGERAVWSVWRGEGWTKHSLGSGKERGVGCEDSRAPGMGRRLILPAGAKPEEEMEEVNESTYRVRRYLKGVAEGQDEIVRETALPQQSNIDLMGGIDYRKGCYVGQELTIRTHHTGVVRKRILPVMLYRGDESIPTTLEYLPEKDLGIQDIPAGTNIARLEKSRRNTGNWLAGMGNIGLGLCRLEVMTDVNSGGELSAYKEGSEFKLEWGLEEQVLQMARVKAFVPLWHLTKQW